MNYDWMDIATLIGATGAWIVSRNQKVRKWGFLFDLVACFAWSYYTFKYIKTPGAMIVQVAYLGAALNGIREHFWKVALLIIFIIPSSGQAQVFDYWANPDTTRKGHRPEFYKQSLGKSEYLVNLFDSLQVPKNARVLEIGCNVGRNLRYLYDSGWQDLYGIEINKSAVDSAICPEAKLYPYPVQNVLPHMEKAFDVIFTMAVLQHIPDTSFYKDIERLNAGWLILIEDEYEEGEFHWPRKYNQFFDGEVLSSKIVSVQGLNKNFRLRVFRNGG